jgi:hypothetical protein
MMVARFNAIGVPQFAIFNLRCFFNPFPANRGIAGLASGHLSAIIVGWVAPLVSRLKG